MLKKETRRIYKEKRLALGAAERSKMDDLLLIQFQAAQLPVVETVFSYWPYDKAHEPNTFLITDYLAFQVPALQPCYPRINAETNTMDAIAVDPDTAFKNNLHNIPEPMDGLLVNPASIDMVIVPLLAFDKKGYRVGFGKGYYDRFLAGCRKDCLVVGLSYFDAIDELEDCNDFDVPLSHCITPYSVYVF